MAGIGEASAILGVAQIGLQLAQTLVTVIGDFRDAATNINRLRDEIHLTSVCLQQLGDLAKEDRLIPGRGVLEATNLRERCRGVIWEIRTIIKKGDNPLRPDEITKDDIDVSYFMAWKWALWTKKHLEDPRQELDRLKDSMTLTFVTHMAILANNDYERKMYKNQIPGMKRNVVWAEEKWRQDQQDEQPLVPQEILDAGPEGWQQFIQWKSGTIQTHEPKDPLMGVSVEQPRTGHQAWSLDPFVGRVKMPVTDEWIQNELRSKQTSEQMWKIHSKLQPWYKQQLDGLISELNSPGSTWSLTSLKLIRRSFFRRVENPPSLQVVLKGENRPLQLPTARIAGPEIVSDDEVLQVDYPVEAVPYSMTYELEEPMEKTDEEIIEEELAKYRADS